jgi:hypothetical protein
MADEYAGIYLIDEAEKAFYRLPEERQEQLAAFLEQERVKLEASGGGNKEGCAAEWAPGFAVYWSVNLKPEYRKQKRGHKAAKLPDKLGAAYRIEVLEIRRID